MKIVVVKGGLGNQMFQYALYKRLQQHDENVLLDVSEYEHCRHHQGYELEKRFGIQADYATVNMLHAFKNKRGPLAHAIRWLIPQYGYKGTHFCQVADGRTPYSFCPSLFESSEHVVLDGYWQNLRYMDTVEQSLKADFDFIFSHTPENEEMAAAIQSCESVSVHVRRKDYIGNGDFADICDRAYYLRAFERIKALMQNPSFFVFSDDISWCRDTFGTESMTFVDINGGENAYMDMLLMSLCRHNIMANSTFSWWSAWLNKNEGKIVIMPEQWTRSERATCLKQREWIML